MWRVIDDFSRNLYAPTSKAAAAALARFHAGIPTAQDDPAQLQRFRMAHSKRRLVRDEFGNLYGTTKKRAARNPRVAQYFRLAPSGSLHRLHSFQWLARLEPIPNPNLISDGAGT